MNTPERRSTELNEVRWWSNWARLRWRGEGYLLSSESLREPFFNRAGSLVCRGVVGTAPWAERCLSHLDMSPTFLVFDSCAAARALQTSGYRHADTMTVLVSKGHIGEGGRGQVVGPATSPEGWTGAYLSAFYGSEELAGVVSPIVASLLKASAVTLLESKVKGETAGVLALFRTSGIIGAYCVGTVPRYRKKGVATGLLAKARQIAETEGRALVLQTLRSDGALQFYLDRGFEVAYSKLVLEKSSNLNRESNSEVDLGVSVARKTPVGLHHFANVFEGFELVPAVRAIFGEKTDMVLDNLSVEITESGGYMRINDKKGSIVVNAGYLREGSEVDIYLDVVHELVHIRQHAEGKELWDKKYEYVDRPTEIEAYKVAVREARRIGMTEAQVAQYLKVEWIPEKAFQRFLRNVGVKT